MPRAERLSQEPTDTTPTDFIGIARQLSLKPAEAPAPTCSCVRAVVGQPSNPSFDWHGQPAPKVGFAALVIGVSSEGIPCDTKEAGASIAGFYQDGDNVIVEVEPWKPNIPQATGAIIPKPGENGAVYLRARGGSPYGKPINGGHGPGGRWCLVYGGQGASAAASQPVPELP